MVTPARRIAFDILRRVEAEGAFAGELLHAKLSGARAQIKREDAALATELTQGVLRWQRLLDFLIARQTGKPTATLDIEVLLALRLGMYQLRFLSRVPGSAAVNESVELVKAARKRSAAPLVNAVLRKAPREAIEKLLPPDLAPESRLGIVHSHPDWLVRRWLTRFGETRAVALLEANNRAPRLACAVHQPAQREAMEQEFRHAGMEVEPGAWLRNSLLIRSGNPAASESFRRGWFSIQDEASQMVAHLLDVREDDSVLDICAAPGGKTAILARAAGPQSLVVAADLHAHRLQALLTTLARLNIASVRRVALDATSPLPFGRSFARILLDAPCSGTGTLARNPEIRWRLQPADLSDLQRRQVALLKNALVLLASGGRLVYSTCSLEPEENELVVDEALQAVRGFHRVHASGALEPHLREGASTTRLFDGVFRTFPPEHGTDGFFAAAVEHE
ncbi:MAG: 16S rRNA (cytosine(967)-C(5))-methyltransferase RsmB [Acidobacteria bacterium]|nr:16S rRNA (cytosine(967)-C(5))-methyltransferase RsmB [Acidobacteriota bacterium]